MLSPYLFNIFIDWMLDLVQNNENGIRIGRNRYNCFAYADDVTLFCATAPGLQELINICTEYATLWRFKFSVTKSKCMIAGHSSLRNNLEWFLGQNDMDNVKCLEILGTIFSNDGRSKLNMDKRVKSCRQSFYSLQPVGMCHGGLGTAAKVHLWKTICLPTLLYGTDAVNIDRSDMAHLKSVQGSLIKTALGISKRSHHSHLVRALGICNIMDTVEINTLSLFYRVYRCASPYRTLCNFLLAQYISNGKAYAGTMVARIINMGYSPTEAAFHKKKPLCNKPYDGLTDTLDLLCHHVNFNNQNAQEHVLVTLLTKAF